MTGGVITCFRSMRSEWRASTGLPSPSRDNRHHFVELSWERVSLSEVVTGGTVVFSTISEVLIAGGTMHVFGAGRWLAIKMAAFADSDNLYE